MPHMITIRQLLSSVGLCACLLSTSIVAMGAAPSLPPGESAAKGALEKSPRHGEWVDVKVEGAPAPIKCFIVYPERKDKAPVVVVIHEVFGETDWIRGVADQLAAEGFIAIAPDLLSGVGPNSGGTDSLGGRDNVVKAIQALKPEAVMNDLDAVREYATQLPSSNGKSATIGFCWGGATSFAYAAHQPKLDAAVVYYGTPPGNAGLEKVQAPVMGFYGGADNRVTSTVKPTEATMKQLGKKYTAHVYDGAGHGFLRQQDGREGANQKATEQAWPATMAFLKENTEAK